VYYFIVLSCCLHSGIINHKKIKGKERIHATSQLIFLFISVSYYLFLEKEFWHFWQFWKLTAFIHYMNCKSCLFSLLIWSYRKKMPKITFLLKQIHFFKVYVYWKIKSSTIELLDHLYIADFHSKIICFTWVISL
jgi:hypothetical protein